MPTTVIAACPVAEPGPREALGASSLATDFISAQTAGLDLHRLRTLPGLLAASQTHHSSGRTAPGSSLAAMSICWVGVQFLRGPRVPDFYGAVVGEPAVVQMCGHQGWLLR
jgi:hypothetical protein